MKDKNKNSKILHRLNISHAADLYIQTSMPVELH